MLVELTDGQSGTPTSVEPKWLLLSGASDPPSRINISDRRTRDIPGVRSGTFLSGVAHDLANMEAAVESNLFNVVRDLYLTKSEASGHIQRFFDTCKREGVKPILYYTGHGEIGVLLMVQSVFKKFLICFLEEVTTQ